MEDESVVGITNYINFGLQARSTRPRSCVLAISLQAVWHLSAPCLLVMACRQCGESVSCMALVSQCLSWAWMISLMRVMSCMALASRCSSLAWMVGCTPGPRALCPGGHAAAEGWRRSRRRRERQSGC